MARRKTISRSQAKEFGEAMRAAIMRGSQPTEEQEDKRSIFDRVSNKMQEAMRVKKLNPYTLPKSAILKENKPAVYDYDDSDDSDDYRLTPQEESEAREKGIDTDLPDYVKSAYIRKNARKRMS